MRRPGSNKVIETCPDPFELDVLIRPARRRSDYVEKDVGKIDDLEVEVSR